MTLLLVLFLTGCVSSPDYNTSLQQWVGASQESLMNIWGDPASINFVTPNQQLLTYFQTGTDGELFCRTTFTITDGDVTNFAFEGDNCSVQY